MVKGAHAQSQGIFNWRRRSPPRRRKAEEAKHSHLQSDPQQWATIAGRSPCRTPNLNRLAAAGMLFERSRALTLSGAYHWHNGVYNQIHSSPSVHRDLDPDWVRYSQRLRDAGYREGPERATPEAYIADFAIRMMERFARGPQPWHPEAHWEPHDAYMPLKKYLDRYAPAAGELIRQLPQ